jgi:hypothetical protein
MALLKSQDNRALFLLAMVVVAMAIVLAPCPAHGGDDGMYIYTCILPTLTIFYLFTF